jgi:ABC-type transport system involved in multi-copper enzyme maturation permease subunit
MSTLTATTRAELLRLRRWPTLWVLAGIWTTLQVTFSFAFPYLAYRSGDPDAFQGGPSDQLLASMLPDAVPQILVQGTPMFGGAIVLILGALAAGSGYGWGTWKTVFTQGPGRGSALAGTIVSLGLAVVALVLWTLCLDLALSTVVALTESQPVVLPALGETARAAGGAALVLGMWSAGGLFLGTLTRGPALSVGLGLVWTLVVENLLRGAANLLDALTVLTDRLPGTAAGSLAGALGAAAEGPDATPGVLTVLSGPVAAATTAAYLIAFLVAAVVLVRRRDLT